MKLGERKALTSRFKTTVGTRNEDEIIACVKDMIAMQGFDLNRPFPEGRSAGGRAFRYPGYTPLIILARYGYARAVEVLLTDASIDFSVTRNGYHALLSAAAKGKTDVVHALIGDFRCTPEVVMGKTEKGQSAIVKAAEQGHGNVVDLLKDVPGVTLEELGAAKQAAGNDAIVSMLESKIADLNLGQKASLFEGGSPSFFGTASPELDSKLWLEMPTVTQVQPSAPPAAVLIGIDQLRRPG